MSVWGNQFEDRNMSFSGRQRTLTVRDLEMICLVARGKSLPEIAKELAIPLAEAVAQVQSVSRKMRNPTRSDGLAVLLTNDYCAG